MIGNFEIGCGATLPYLDVIVMRDGRLSLYTQAVPSGCAADSVNPDVVDLSDVWSVNFEMWKPGRCPQLCGTAGVASVLGDPKQGNARYVWAGSDTLCPGLYYGQFVFNFNDGSILRFPFQKESLAIEIMG